MLLEFLLFPLITGLVASLCSVLFEYYIVIPKREIESKLNSDNNIPFSIKYIFIQFAGIITFEIIIRVLFPKLTIPQESIINAIKDIHIAFAAIFYISFASILSTFNSKSKVLSFVGIYLIPFIVSIWWAYYFIKSTKSFNDKYETILPVIHNGLLIWIFIGLKDLISKKIILILPIIFFPINAFLLLRLTTDFSAWGSSLVTSILMIGIMASIIHDRESEEIESRRRIKTMR